MINIWSKAKENKKEMSVDVALSRRAKTWSVTSYYNNFFRYISHQIDQNEYYRRFDSRMPRNYLLSQRIRQITLPTDTIYIWGTDPGVYVLSNRLQSGKLVTSFHVEDLNYYDQTTQIIQQAPPSVIVVMQDEWRSFEALDDILSTHYLLVAKIADPKLTSQGIFKHQAFVYKKI